MRKSFEPIWNQTQKISGQIFLDVEKKVIVKVEKKVICIILKSSLIYRLWCLAFLMRLKFSILEVGKNSK